MGDASSGMLPRMRFRSLNPFATVDRPREVWAWGMYDLANQSFQLLINTLLFSLYVKGVLADDPKGGGSLWASMAAVQLGLTALLTPVLGAMADARNWHRAFLLGSGCVCAGLTMALGAVGKGDVALAFGVYVIAATACGVGESFLGAFLPRISTPETVGRVSGIGWTMSYVGALGLLGITWGAIKVMGWTDVGQMRPMFVFAGAWFLAGMVPAILFLRENAGSGATAESPGGAVGAAFRRLGESIRNTRKYGQLTRFLLIFFVYTAGVQAMIFFLGQIGDAMGFALPQLTLLALVMAVSAGCGSATTAWVQDRLGHRRTIIVFLGVWFAGTLAAALTRHLDLPEEIFWGVSALLGIGLGGTGSASRALVGLLTPDDREGEVFGLWSLATKLSAVAGVLLMGAFGIDRGLLVLAGVFALGGVLMFAVDERAGAEAARGGRTVGHDTGEP